jgi:tRNA dimethylallyltransferase
LGEQRPELTVIAGPTGAGKSALALRLAEKWDAEIVSADSQQVYRYFDLGTAKPTAEELARVPHHLVSIVEPTEAFSAGRFVALADEAIASIARRGRRVLVVGGTGLYLRALLRGLFQAPGADEALRAKLWAQAEHSEGRRALHEQLRAVDPESADKVPPENAVRVIRYLEIHAATGKAPSQWRREHGFSEQRYPHRFFVLAPPKVELDAAIEARARAMYANGLVAETASLVERGFREAAPMSSVGYKEAVEVVEGRWSEAQAIAATAQKTRQYAKRQLTWFRREPSVRWLVPPYAELWDEG